MSGVIFSTYRLARSLPNFNRAHAENSGLIGQYIFYSHMIGQSQIKLRLPDMTSYWMLLDGNVSHQGFI